MNSPNLLPYVALFSTQIFPKGLQRIRLFSTFEATPVSDERSLVISGLSRDLKVDNLITLPFHLSTLEALDANHRLSLLTHHLVPVIRSVYNSLFIHRLSA